MVVIEFNPKEESFVARLKPGGDQQDDFQQVLSTLDAFTARDSALRPAVMIMLEPGHALPDATRRALAAKVTGSDHFAINIAVVTRNPLFKGVLTALSWVRKAKYDIKVCASPGQAIAWLEEKRGASLPELVQLVESVMLKQSA